MPTSQQVEFYRIRRKLLRGCLPISNGRLIPSILHHPSLLIHHLLQRPSHTLYLPYRYLSAVSTTHHRFLRSTRLHGCLPKPAPPPVLTCDWTRNHMTLFLLSCCGVAPFLSISSRHHRWEGIDFLPPARRFLHSQVDPSASSHLTRKHSLFDDADRAQVASSSVDWPLAIVKILMRSSVTESVDPGYR